MSSRHEALQDFSQRLACMIQQESGRGKKRAFAQKIGVQPQRVDPSRAEATRTIAGTLWYLCTTDPDPTAPDYQKTMDSTWTNPAITGVFIRLKWSDLQAGPTIYNETTLRRLLSEVDKAVAHGKVYSIGIKSGAENDA